MVVVSLTGEPRCPTMKKDVDLIRHLKESTLSCAVCFSNASLSEQSVRVVRETSARRPEAEDVLRTQEASLRAGARVKELPAARLRLRIARSPRREGPLQPAASSWQPLPRHSSPGRREALKSSSSALRSCGSESQNGLRANSKANARPASFPTMEPSSFAASAPAERSPS